MQRYFLLICLLGTLSSCSNMSSMDILHNHDHHQLKDTNIPPLKIPPGIKSDQFDNKYPIPNRHYPPTNGKIDLEPPGLNTD